MRDYDRGIDGATSGYPSRYLLDAAMDSSALHALADGAVSAGSASSAQSVSPPVPPPPKVEPKLSPLWMLLPSGTAGLSALFDAKVVVSMSKVRGLDDATARNTFRWIEYASDAATTALYVGLQPGLSDGWALAADISYPVVAGLGIAFGITFEIGNHSLGQSLVYNGVKVASNIGAARLHRHVGRRIGGIGEIILGAVAFPISFALKGRPEVSKGEEAVKPETCQAVRDPDTGIPICQKYFSLPGNPYESSPLPDLPATVRGVAIDHALSGAFWLAYSLLKKDDPKGISWHPSLHVGLGPGDRLMSLSGGIAVAF